jgi:hypothetical protein
MCCVFKSIPCSSFEAQMVGQLESEYAIPSSVFPQIKWYNIRTWHFVFFWKTRLYVMSKRKHDSFWLLQKCNLLSNSLETKTFEVIVSRSNQPQANEAVTDHDHFDCIRRWCPPNEPTSKLEVCLGLSNNGRIDFLYITNIFIDQCIVAIMHKLVNIQALNCNTEVIFR